MNPKILLDKYRELSVHAKVVLWFTFAGFLQRGISVITTSIFTRVLTTGEYGLFSVYSAWSNVLVIIATLYLHMAVMNNAFMKVDKTKEQVVSAFQGLSLCISLVCLFIYLIFHKQIDEVIGLPFIVNLGMFISFVFIPPYNYWMIYKRYSYDYKKMTVLSIAIALLTPACGLVGVFMTDLYKGEARILGKILVQCVVGFAFMIVNWRKNHTYYDKELWKYGLVFNLPLIPHFLSEILLNESDRIMINMLIGSSAAGVYSIAYMVASLVMIFSSALNTALVPWQYEKLQQKKYEDMAGIVYFILCGLGIISSMLIMFAPEVVRILAGEEYAQAVFLIPTLAASVFFNYLYQTLARVEMYYGKRSYTVFGTAVAALLNIILNYLFIPRFGYVAAGYSTLLCHIILCVLHYLFYRKVCRDYIGGIKIYSAYVIILISLLVLIVAGIMTFLYDYLMLRIVFIIVIITILVICRKRILNIVKKLWGNREKT